MPLPIWRWITGSHHYAPRSPHTVPHHLALGAVHAASHATIDPWLAVAIVGGAILTGSLLLMSHRPTI